MVPSSRVSDQCGRTWAPGIVMTLAAFCASLLAIPSMQAQTLRTLHNFTGEKDGGVPYAGLIHDEAGNLYGTASTGGAFMFGTVFELTSTGKLIVLHSFTGSNDGGTPYAALVRDAAGNLYGTTLAGGSYGDGTVFKIDVGGQETVLHSFSQVAGNGLSPVASVLRDKLGNFFGVAQTGGDLDDCPPYGCGTVFWLNAAYKERSISFNGTDGATPYAGLIEDAEGNLYGTTTERLGSGRGTVFRIDKTFKMTVVYRFSGDTDGLYPDAGLVMDSAGNLYGTTYLGGAYGWGTIYKVDATGQESIIHSFTNNPDGAYPDSALIFDAQGNLYGTTVSGGVHNAGTIFELGKTGMVTILHSFDLSDGAQPSCTLLRDKAGNLYGTTPSWGTGRNCSGGYGCGTIFKLTPKPQAEDNLEKSR
jgi:uncharacterized repeat protein (TIGR03803 family)